MLLFHAVNKSLMARRKDSRVASSSVELLTVAASFSKYEGSYNSDRLAAIDKSRTVKTVFNQDGNISCLKTHLLIEGW